MKIYNGTAGIPAEVDLVVIGLGVTGAGVALDAASRGLSVLAVDAHDIAFGTSRWSSKLVHGGLRYLASGQVGIAPDGSVAAGAEAQMDQALANLGAILAAHGMTPANLVKMTAFLTDTSMVAAWRARRGAWIGEHRSASTLLVVAGLADPRFLMEVEAEAAD